MAGHSHAKNIMHRKAAQGARKARAFGKLIREITVSARQGLPDPAANPRLRAAVRAALPPRLKHVLHHHADLALDAADRLLQGAGEEGVRRLDADRELQLAVGVEHARGLPAGWTAGQPPEGAGVQACPGNDTRLSRDREGRRPSGGLPGRPSGPIAARIGGARRHRAL